MVRNRDLEYENQGRMYVADPAATGNFLQYEGMRTYDMIFTLVLVGEGFGEAMEMASALGDGIEAEPYLYVPADTDVWPDREYEKMPLFVTQDPEQASGENRWRAVSFAMEVTVQGLRVKGREARERVQAIDQFSVWHLGNTVVVS